MTYKTILAYFTDDAGLAAVLGPTLALARRFNAHVIGMTVVPPILFQPSYVPGGRSTVIDEHRKAFVVEAAKMKPVFETAVRDAGVSAEWLEDDANLMPACRRVIEYGAAADLIVVGIPYAKHSGTLMPDGVEQIVLQSGRPVLLVPRTGDHTGLGRRIAVAWNGRREASRAAFDALPLMAGAERVAVVWVNPRDDQAQDLPGADLCTTLARHNIKCEATEVAAPEAKAGEAVLGFVRESGSDLLVMGCFGHSRLYEFVLGGATRYVLQHATVPVLMSH